MLIGVGAVVVAMTLNSVGALLQADGALRATRSRPIALQPRYLLGLSCDGVAWIFSAFALRFLPVFAVQAVLGGAIAITALAGQRLFGTRLRVIDRFGVAACLLGLLLVAVSAGPPRPPSTFPSRATDIILVSSVIVLGVVVLVLRRGRRGWPLAVVAGLGYGGSSLAVRAAHVQAGPHEEPLALLAQPATYLLVGFFLVGLAGYSAALGRGEVSSMTALLTVTEVVVPGLAGILLLGDQIRPGWWAVLIIGLVVAIVGVVILANAPHAPRPLH